MQVTRWLVTPVVALALTSPAAGQSLQVSERLETLEQRAERDSLDPVAHYNLGLGYLSKKRWPQADASLERAVGIDPQFAQAWLAYAIARFHDEPYWHGLRKLGRDSLVAGLRHRDRAYRKAFLLDPLVDVKILGSISWIRPWGDFPTGLKRLVEGKYDEAWKHFDRVVDQLEGARGIDEVPEYVLWLRSLAASHSERTEEAIQDLEVLVRIARNSASEDSTADETPLRANEYRYLMASLHQRAGRVDRAVDLFREVAQNDLGNYMAHVRLAAIHEAARDYPRAVAERSLAVDVNPDDASLLLDLGVTLGKAGDFSAAETRFQQALELNPRDVRPLFWLGIARQQLGKAAEAREAFSRYVALAPSRYDRQIAMARERLAQLAGQ